MDNAQIGWIALGIFAVCLLWVALVVGVRYFLAGRKKPIAAEPPQEHPVSGLADAPKGATGGPSRDASSSELGSGGGRGGPVNTPLSANVGRSGRFGGDGSSSIVAHSYGYPGESHAPGESNQKGSGAVLAEWDPLGPASQQQDQPYSYPQSHRASAQLARGVSPAGGRMGLSDAALQPHTRLHERLPDQSTQRSQMARSSLALPHLQQQPSTAAAGGHRQALTAADRPPPPPKRGIKPPTLPLQAPRERLEMGIWGEGWQGAQSSSSGWQGWGSADSHQNDLRALELEKLRQQQLALASRLSLIQEQLEEVRVRGDRGDALAPLGSRQAQEPEKRHPPLAPSPPPLPLHPEETPAAPPLPTPPPPLPPPPPTTTTTTTAATPHTAQALLPLPPPPTTTTSAAASQTAHAVHSELATQFQQLQQQHLIQQQQQLLAHLLQQQKPPPLLHSGGGGGVTVRSNPAAGVGVREPIGTVLQQAPAPTAAAPPGYALGGFKEPTFSNVGSLRFQEPQAPLPHPSPSLNPSDALVASVMGTLSAAKHLYDGGAGGPAGGGLGGGGEGRAAFSSAPSRGRFATGHYS
jgi:hypothetical protein